jgi:hypothetical protein
MKTEILNPAVHVAIGVKRQSNSTMFINGADVFLVEAMAAREDAEKLRHYVEVPESGLIIASDAVVGNIVYLRYSSMAVLNRALKRLQRAGRKYLLIGHMVVRSIDAIHNALFYLGRLRQIVIAARETSAPTESLLKTELQTCLPPGVVATDFEEAFHRRNLETIAGRRFHLH